MDPDTALKWIEDTYKSMNVVLCIAHCVDLDKWLNKGGFAPCWNDYPIGKVVYENFVDEIK